LLKPYVFYVAAIHRKDAKGKYKKRF